MDARRTLRTNLAYDFFICSPDAVLTLVAGMVMPYATAKAFMNTTKARNKSRCFGILGHATAPPRVQVYKLEPKHPQILPPNTPFAARSSASTEMVHLFTSPMAAVPFFAIPNGGAPFSAHLHYITIRTQEAWPTPCRNARNLRGKGFVT